MSFSSFSSRLGASLIKFDDIFLAKIDSTSDCSAEHSPLQAGNCRVGHHSEGICAQGGGAGRGGACEGEGGMSGGGRVCVRGYIGGWLTSGEPSSTASYQQ